MSSTINPDRINGISSTLAQFNINLTTKEFNWNNVTQIGRTPSSNYVVGSNKNYVSSDIHTNMPNYTGTWNLNSDWTKNGGSQGQFQSLFAYTSETTKLNTSAFRNEHYNLVYQKNVIVLTGLPGRVQRSELSYTPQIQDMMGIQEQLQAQKEQMYWNLIGEIAFTFILTIITMWAMGATSDLLLGDLGEVAATGDELLTVLRDLSLVEKLQYMGTLFAINLGAQVVLDVGENGLPTSSNDVVNRLVNDVGWAALMTAFMFLDGLARFAERQRAALKIMMSPESPFSFDQIIHVAGEEAFIYTRTARMVMTISRISHAFVQSFMYLQIGQLMNNDFSLNYNQATDDAISSIIGKLFLGASLGMAFYKLASGILGIEGISAGLLIMGFAVSYLSFVYLYQQQSVSDERYQVHIMNWVSDIAQSAQHSNNVIVRGFGPLLGTLSLFVYHDFVVQRLFVTAFTDMLSKQIVDSPYDALRSGILQENGLTIDPNFIVNYQTYGRPNELNFNANVLQFIPMFGMMLLPYAMKTSK